MKFRYNIYKTGCTNVYNYHRIWLFITIKLQYDFLHMTYVNFSFEKPWRAISSWWRYARIDAEKLVKKTNTTKLHAIKWIKKIYIWFVWLVRYYAWWIFLHNSYWMNGQCICNQRAWKCICEQSVGPKSMVVYS